MRYTKFAAILMATALLSACGEEECTEELVQAKTAELTTLMQEVMAKDPQKMLALQPKLEEMQKEAMAAGDDMQAACAALDELIAELKK
jgi:outer membrane murein-binding lipoprotein Lpp